MSREILYQQTDPDFTLIDLPSSIEIAQISSRQVLSIEPLCVPYRTPEPRESKRDKLRNNFPAAHNRYHEHIATHVATVVGAILRKQTLSWCLPRWTITGDVVEVLSRTQLSTSRPSSPCPPVILSPLDNHFASLNLLENVVVNNPGPERGRLIIDSLGSFYIPACSTFLLGSISTGADILDAAIGTLLLESSLFDLIVLDPPWSNRSVRKAKVYQTSEYQSKDPFEQCLPVVGTKLAVPGLVAIWITNKATIRSTVIDTFSRHGLWLYEEWIWIKVTTKGEPVMPLDGLWRKPYEILLLFRQVPSETSRLRIIASVPDVHSRKPSLKSLLESYLPNRYNALEIFARSLTAGWWSWGDEVLKFQHESYWRALEQ